MSDVEGRLQGIEKALKEPSKKETMKLTRNSTT